MIEIALAETLAADASVAALATGGVHQLVVPQHESRPAIRVQLIDQPRRAHLRGYLDVWLSRVQIDAFAQLNDDTPDPYTAISDLSDAIDAALGPEPFTTAGSPALEVLLVLRDDRRPFEPDEHWNIRMMQDYRVWHRGN